MVEELFASAGLFFHLISLVKVKSGKQRLHVLSKKNLQLLEYVLTGGYYSTWSKAAQSPILAQRSNWVSPAMTQWNMQPGTTFEPLDSRKFPSSNSKVCGSNQRNWVLQIFCNFDFFLNKLQIYWNMEQKTLNQNPVLNFKAKHSR